MTLNPALGLTGASFFSHSICGNGSPMYMHWRTTLLPSTTTISFRGSVNLGFFTAVGSRWTQKRKTEKKEFNLLSFDIYMFNSISRDCRHRKEAKNITAKLDV